MEFEGAWLTSCRQAILASDEWRQISSDVHVQLEQILAEDRAGHLSDLTPVEQLAFMAKVEARRSYRTISIYV